MNGSVWVSYDTRAQDASVIQVLRGSSECWDGGASISGGNALTKSSLLYTSAEGSRKIGKGKCRARRSPSIDSRQHCDR